MKNVISKNSQEIRHIFFSLSPSRKYATTSVPHNLWNVSCFFSNSPFLKPQLALHDWGWHAQFTNPSHGEPSSRFYFLIEVWHLAKIGKKWKKLWHPTLHSIISISVAPRLGNIAHNLLSIDEPLPESWTRKDYEIKNSSEMSSAPLLDNNLFFDHKRSGKNICCTKSENPVN